MARLVPTVALALSESPIVSKYRYPGLEYFSCAGAVLKVGFTATCKAIMANSVESLAQCCIETP